MCECFIDVCMVVASQRNIVSMYACGPKDQVGVLMQGVN